MNLNWAYRLAFRMAYPMARRWWRLVGHEGVVVAAWLDDQVLVVRHSYKPNWRLPGGGIKRRETPQMAASRELREETGVIVAPSDLREVFKINGYYGWMHVLETHFHHIPILTIDHREIIEAGFRSAIEAAETNRQILSYLRHRNIAWAA